MLYRDVRLAAMLESPDAFSSRYSDAVSRSDESWREQADSSATGSDRATFLILDGEPVGIAALYRDAADPDTGELIQMWVSPEKSGGTAAAELIGKIFRWAAGNGFSQVKAEVMANNPRALRFYGKCGFIPSSGNPQLTGRGVVLVREVGGRAITDPFHAG